MCARGKSTVVPKRTCEGQTTTCRNRFSPFSTWVTGMWSHSVYCLSGLVSNAFTSWVILPAQVKYIIKIHPICFILLMWPLGNLNYIWGSHYCLTALVSQAILPQPIPQHSCVWPLMGCGPPYPNIHVHDSWWAVVPHTLTFTYIIPDQLWSPIPWHSRTWPLMGCVSPYPDIHVHDPWWTMVLHTLTFMYVTPDGLWFLDDWAYS